MKYKFEIDRRLPSYNEYSNENRKKGRITYASSIGKALHHTRHLRPARRRTRRTDLRRFGTVSRLLAALSANRKKKRSTLKQWIR